VASSRVAKMLMLGCSLLLAGTLASARTATAPKKTMTAHHARKASGKTSSKKGKRSKTVSWRKRGQQNIDSQRARDIQGALIREHYMEGEPSGVWDATSQKAMERYQADNGWQSKSIPDSRALIKLGLGPDHQHLLNPESAMTTQPATHSSSTPSEDGPNQPQK
jgi:hypothetical protein